jgi:N-acetylmuramoyl-L-alanine amidase
MRVKGATFQKFLLGLALLSALVWNLAYASEINGLHLSAGATGTRAEIALDSPAEFKVIRLTAPERLVVDLPGASVAKGLALPAGTGIVKAVRSGHPVAGTTRIVFDLNQSITALQPRIEQGAGGPRLVVEWPGDGAATAAVATGTTPPGTSSPAQPPVPSPREQAEASAAATSRLISELTSTPATAATKPAAGAAGDPIGGLIAASKAPTTVATGVPAPVDSGDTSSAPAAAAATAPVKTLQQVMEGRGMRPLIIAIDPGHGGQDPGALGPNGSREKDVVLAISKELARQVNATPGLKAYLTRDTDVFIPLNRRAVLARQAKADMFISIHADAAENRNADGSSVYVLSLKGASSQRARWLANKENASDLVGGVRLEQTNNTLASVLLDLTQSGHMKASEEAASEILDGLMQVGNVHKRQIERANFAVLRTSDMPAMLVETAFISNPEEERRLKDPAFQRKVAGAVLDGINTFFTRQPPPGTMYAARAAAQAGAIGAAGGSP